MNNGKICVSVCAETASELVEKIERAAKIADVIELRFDCLEKIEPEIFWRELKRVHQNYKGEFLATFRPKEQGGNRDLSVKERKDFWHDSHVYEFVDWGDFEFDLQNDDWHLYFRGVFKRIIRSLHEFSDISSNLNDIYANLAQKAEYSNSLKKQRDVIKIAIQSTDATDGLRLIKLLDRANSENKELIPIAMGEYGIWTRILGLSRGAFMTFASLDDESATAPGQLTAQEMIDVYRVKELDENSEIYGLVSSSIVHSVSPQMHNAAFKFHGLNAVYVPFAVKNLEEFMRRMVNPATREIAWNLQGLSVTIPYKIEIMKYLTHIDQTAQKIGAVNTIYIVENDVAIYGTNTDAEGFIVPLRNMYGTLLGARAAVLGAGGAARAVCYALTQAGVNVKIFARNLEKAKALQSDFGTEIEQLSNSSYKDFDFLINTTPLGMKKGGLENETPATAEQLEGVGLVYDLVYNPFETRLMREANKVFIPTIGGLAMLVAQAMQQQKIWTGLDAPVKEMSAAALRKLQL